MAAVPQLNYEICSTWDGEQLIHPGMKMEISASSEGDGICIRWLSPYFNDPLPTQPKGNCPGLWDYEVVEFFFLNPTTEEYLEVEVGPGGHFLVLLLRGSRNVIAEGLDLTVETQIHPDGTKWSGTAIIPASLLPTNVTKLNAYAIHLSGDERHYEALHSAQPKLYGQPDFHRLQLFGPINMTKLLGSDTTTGQKFHN